MAVGQFSVSARRSIDSLLENTPVRTKSQTEDDIVAKYASKEYEESKNT